VENASKRGLAIPFFEADIPTENRELETGFQKSVFSDRPNESPLMERDQDLEKSSIGFLEILETGNREPQATEFTGEKRRNG
jgi:hypothetical protein